MIRSLPTDADAKMAEKKKWAKCFFSASVCDAREPPSAHYVFLLEKEITGVKP
jgi:hypothetical protein